MKKKLSLTVICLFMIIAATACETKRETEEPLKLKVLYPLAENFTSRWGEELQKMLPQYQLDIVETDEHTFDEEGSSALAELIAQEKPDIIYMHNEAEYDWFVERNQLVPLDSRVNTNEFPLDAVYTPALDLLKLRDDTLYGLPMFFDTKVLFYNRELFDAYQLPYPHEGITWNEVLQLAEKFTQRKQEDQQIYGLEDYDWDESPYNPFRLAETIARARGVHYLNSERELAIDTEPWKEVFEQVSDAYRRDVFYLPETRELKYDGMKIVNKYVLDKKFLSGQTAMALHRSSLFGYLYDIQHYGTEGTFAVNPFAWGVIPAPTDPSQPTKTTNIEAWAIFGIHPESPHVEDAWQVIRHLTGPDMAEKASDLALFNKRNGEHLTIHAEYIRKDGVVVTGFAQQTLDVQALKIDRTVPREFHVNFRELAGNALYSVIEGSLSIEEALAELQQDGQLILSRY